MRYYLIIFVFIISNCKSKTVDYYPNRGEDTPIGIYNKYKVKLDTAYMVNDKFEVGIQLANLDAPSNIVFEKINEGILEDSSNCHRIYDWYKLFKVYNFRTNIVEADTIEFQNSFLLCEQILGKGSSDKYYAENQKKQVSKEAKRVKLDSTKMNFQLISLLDTIDGDDQKFRKMMHKRNSSEKENAEFWKEQKILDSINLIKIEKILLDGYPSLADVGYDHVGVVWLVLHHQSNIAVRRKYLPVLENANVGSGALETYNERTKNMMLAKGQ